MRPTSYALGGASVVALAIGAGFGVSAMADGDTVAERCPGNVCDAEGLAAHESGRSAATVAVDCRVMDVPAYPGGDDPGAIARSWWRSARSTSTTRCRAIRSA